MSVQHQPECQVFQRCGREKSLALLDDLALFHDLILVLRCIHLREFHPEGFEALMQLESHLDERRQDAEVCQRVQHILERIMNHLEVDSVDSETISLICGILDINSFEVAIPREKCSAGGVVQALYKIGCLPEHNCIPNTYKAFDADLSMTLRAACPIGAGQHITLTYTDSLWTTTNRRHDVVQSNELQMMLIRLV